MEKKREKTKKKPQETLPQKLIGKHEVRLEG